MLKATLPALALVLLISVGCNDSTTVAPIDNADTRKNSRIAGLVSSEELILRLTRKLKLLNESTLNLRIPSGRSRDLFSDQLEYIGVKPTPDTDSLNNFACRINWQVGSTSQVSQTDFQLWRPLFERFAHFNYSKFYFIDGQLNENKTSFDSTIGFTAVGEVLSGQLANVDGLTKVTWQRPDVISSSWKIVRWKTQRLSYIRCSQSMFSEQMKHVVADQSLVEQLSSSAHQDITRRLVNGEKASLPENYPFHFPEVTLEHPGVSVVDINRDGLDDFYLTRQYLTNLLLVNRGDGRFVEQGSVYGLDIDGGCTASLFFDADNDGDLDLFLGRARERALFLINEDGNYVDHSNKCDFTMPYMVSAISAADYNRDGLLDLYLCTYSPIEGAHHRMGATENVWPSVFLTPTDAQRFKELLTNGNRFTEMPGPPNFLLTNTGNGNFKISDVNDLVGSWKMSLTSCWSDFDKDGDPDLYICNDFAPDDLFLNHGENGFVRAAEDIGLSQFGWGMGITWGDHNNDGQSDMYVSNMYSKAGMRITRQLPELSPDFGQAASGNYLYEFRGGKFYLVSNPDGPHATVAKAGWSWGGQFSDVDNDGFLDIHVGAGYYTAPDEIAEEIDL